MIRMRGRDVYKVCLPIIILLSLFSNAAFSDAFYFKRPLFNGNILEIRNKLLLTSIKIIKKIF